MRSLARVAQSLYRSDSRGTTLAGWRARAANFQAYVQESEVNHPGSVVGDASLAELRDRFTASDAEWKNIRTDLVKKQQRQKTKELQQLKVCSTAGGLFCVGVGGGGVRAQVFLHGGVLH